jgi:SAM-dependent methyltransferase
MRKTATALTDGARDVLERVEIVDQGAAVRLPDQLDRKLYVEVAEGLKRAGFVWDKRAKLHILSGGDAEAALAQLGVMREMGVAPHANPDAWYPTPRPIADLAVERLLEAPGYHYNARVLEPSCGEGALLKALRDKGGKLFLVQAIEIDQERAEYTRRRIGGSFGHFSVIAQDFMDWPGDRKYPPSYDLILMNPPFDNGAAARHIAHAWKMLRPGGRLVAIAPGMAPSGTLGKLCSEWTARIEPLPPASFHESGTDIHTCLLTVDNWGAL